MESFDHEPELKSENCQLVRSSDRFCDRPNTERIAELVAHTQMLRMLHAENDAQIDESMSNALFNESFSFHLGALRRG